MRASTAECIAQICADLLGLNRVDARDDLYELGCDSQQAVRIALAIERAFRVELPLDIVETTGRVDELAAWVEQQIGSRDAFPLASGTASLEEP